MRTGALRNQGDRVWNAFWSGGISNPLEVVDALPHSGPVQEKVEQFLRSHEQHAVIQTIHQGTPLKPQDLRTLELFFYEAEAVGGATQFAEVYGQQQDLPTFVRSIVGLNRKAAKARFAQFLDNTTFTADQIRFVASIIEHLAANGTIDLGLLYGQPYTDIHYKGLDGVFTDAQATALVGIIRAVNSVAA